MATVQGPQLKPGETARVGLCMCEDMFGQLISAHVCILFSGWLILIQYKLINLEISTVFIYGESGLRMCCVATSMGTNS